MPAWSALPACVKGLIMTAPTITLDELQRLGHEVINEKKNSDYRNPPEKLKLRNHLLDEVRRYLTHRLTETENRITPEVLHEMDTIYDTPGVPLALAKLLGYEMYDLQVALGRTVERSCARCNKSLQVVEPRKIGGYTKVSQQYCPRCQQFLNEHSKLQRKSRVLTAQQNTMLAVDVDRTLRGTPDPLALRQYRAKLLAFVQYWHTGERQKTMFNFVYKLAFAGCMICGSEEIHPFVTYQKQIPQNSLFAKLMQHQQIDPLPRMAVKFGLGYEPLETFHQALWRLPPAIYFDFFPEYPLANRPLLILCDECCYSVEETHQLCDVSDVPKPLEWFKVSSP